MACFGHPREGMTQVCLWLLARVSQLEGEMVKPPAPCLYSCGPYPEALLSHC